MSVSLASAADRAWRPADLATVIGEDDDWRRYEILDGVLVVSPPPAPRHDVLASELTAVLRPFVGAAHVATSGVGIDLGRSYRITDATVVTRDYARRSSGLAVPADVLLAVEVESPSSITTDRVTKPAQYAASSIPHYWRVEMDPLRLNVYRLADGAYEPNGSWGEDDTAVISYPFAVTIDLASLLP